MNHKRTFALSVFGLVGILLLAALAIAQTAQASANKRSEKLLGSWNVAVTTPSQGTFPALLTFTADGSVIADESPSPFESSGQGNWIRSDHGEVAYTFVALYGSQEGKNTGKLKVVGTLRSDASKDSWSGPFKIDIFDASGQVIFTDRGTFRLTRIAVESLD
jgi:hypothetical protein